MSVGKTYKAFDNKVSLYGPCGDCGVATKKNYVEILEFTHFTEFFTFTYDSENSRKKELVREITVVVAVGLGTVDTKNFEYES